MGCDIHLYRERRVNGEWETDTIEELEDPTDQYYQYQGFRLIDGRSYTLFAALSNVRNYGSLHVPPPAEDRGYPADACPVNMRCSIQWDADGHSHGYLTIGEVYALKERWEESIVLYEQDDRTDSTFVVEQIDLLIKSMNVGDYFQGIDPDDGRILFFYDN